MTQRTYRILVKGRFDALDDDARARLLAAADEHDPLLAAFTEEGTLTYSRELRHFTFRYVVTASGEDADREARQQAVDKAVAALRAGGYGYRDLNATGTDMTEVRIRRKQRR
ncbi:hypothetical protein LX15_002530 [Streptoalloteichus tenebrarius]|uniref:Uncharacterized protein n=1 Tax=Streptoalloteichus tenebrarius (strain ATCC 17920 / DSM 40477 / JCM 4838 / CBS 697.72 / NBRC 16177 / NCIMB 11028 / NRRL B-12390 / A12253. 1 / ISP 5477) TaxID=1933 RepID=A0ABT1HTK9_STRSD|nr:DUF6204 family protein [Streptoalloteichus tenebrarius]MCP2258832.1 hypothetical protein [Streptoalloteichus tenebrarius]BFE99483.1 hypothetical protein GCM10020241_11590 [Streptoalloteichus tenebrarius]